jgi:drug/metabolite transporter (DMT)-like permease
MSTTPAQPSGTGTQPAGPPLLPLVLLGFLTIATLLGPFVIVLAIRGGPRPEWPPDRPVEWWTLGLVTTIVVALFTACVTAGLWARTRGQTKP